VPEMNPAAAAVLAGRMISGDVAPEMIGDREMTAGLEMKGDPEMIAVLATIAVLAMTEDHEMVPVTSADLATIVVLVMIVDQEMIVVPEMIAALGTTEDPEMIAVLAISEVRGTNHAVEDRAHVMAAACPAAAMTDGADAVTTTGRVDRCATKPNGAAAIASPATSHPPAKIGVAIGTSPAVDAAAKTVVAGVAAVARLAVAIKAVNGAVAAEMLGRLEDPGRSRRLAVVPLNLPKMMAGPSPKRSEKKLFLEAPNIHAEFFNFSLNRVR